MPFAGLDPLVSVAARSAATAMRAQRARFSPPGRPVGEGGREGWIDRPPVPPFGPGLRRSLSERQEGRSGVSRRFGKWIGAVRYRGTSWLATTTATTATAAGGSSGRPERSGGLAQRVDAPAVWAVQLGSPTTGRDTLSRMLAQTFSNVHGVVATLRPLD